MPANFLESYFRTLSVEYILHLVKKEGHLLLCGLVLLFLSSVCGRKCLPLCVYLRVFNISCCREAAASSLVLGDAYSIS